MSDINISTRRTGGSWTPETNFAVPPTADRYCSSRAIHYAATNAVLIFARFACSKPMEANNATRR